MMTNSKITVLNFEISTVTLATPPIMAPITEQASHGEKPKKFNDLNSKRWQQKILFFLTTLRLESSK